MVTHKRLVGIAFPFQVESEESRSHMGDGYIHRRVRDINHESTADCCKSKVINLHRVWLSYSNPKIPLWSVGVGLPSVAPQAGPSLTLISLHFCQPWLSACGQLSVGFLSADLQCHAEHSPPFASRLRTLVMIESGPP